jgi:hypothetical protein
MTATATEPAAFAASTKRTIGSRSSSSSSRRSTRARRSTPRRSRSSPIASREGRHRADRRAALVEALRQVRDRRRRAAVPRREGVGLTHLPAIIRAYTDLQVVEIMAIENGQRDDVPPLEEAAGYKQLLLIDKTYTAAMIAAQDRPHREVRVGPAAAARARRRGEGAARQREIGVEHAEIIAKLKPAEQKRS